MKIKTKSKKVNKQWLQDHANDPMSSSPRKRATGRARPTSCPRSTSSSSSSSRATRRRPGLRAGRLEPVPAAQVCAEEAGAGGAAVGEIERPHHRARHAADVPIEGVTFIQGDFREDAVLAQLAELVGGQLVDVVVSDMAPNLSGVPVTDSARISHLVELAIEFSIKHLKPEGALVTKVFHGSGYSQLVEMFKANFRVVKAVKPKASRDKSSETFLVGFGLKHPAEGA